MCPCVAPVGGAAGRAGGVCLEEDSVGRTAPTFLGVSVGQVREVLFDLGLWGVVWHRWGSLRLSPDHRVLMRLRSTSGGEGGWGSRGRVGEGREESPKIRSSGRGRDSEPPEGPLPTVDG